MPTLAYGYMLTLYFVYVHKKIIVVLLLFVIKFTQSRAPALKFYFAVRVKKAKDVLTEDARELKITWAF